MAIKFESCVEQPVIMGQEYTLWMPTISNAIWQMDQSAPGLDQAKSSWSRDQWISVQPNWKGEEVRVHVTTCFLITSLRICFPFFSVTLNLPTHILPYLPFTILRMLNYSHDFALEKKKLHQRRGSQAKADVGLLPYNIFIHSSSLPLLRLTGTLSVKHCH